MIKTLHRTLKLEKEKFKIPKSVQQAIPIQRIWPDGIFQSGRLFSKSFRFTDINYSIASKLCDLSRNLMLSIDILPVPTDEAVREIQNKLLGVETNVTNWQRRQNENNNFSATIPYEMELQRTETKEMLNDLTTRDQRMMFGVLTIVHMADSYKELNSDTETLKSIARKNLCQLSTLRWQQMDGLHTALPFGPRKINALRTLTTESTAVLIPLVMLNQASTDREELARLLNISDNQLGYITNVKAGSGLIRCSGNLVPFENTFPRNTKLYQLMTTKPGESLKAV